MHRTVTIVCGAMLALSLGLFAAGCQQDQDGTGSHTGSGGNPTSPFNGTFTGNVMIAQGAQETEQAMILTMQANSPLSGTLRLSGGGHGSLNGEAVGNAATFQGTLPGDCPGTVEGTMTHTDTSITLDMLGADCKGSFSTHGVLVRLDDLPACANLAGQWRFEETVTVSCTADGERETDTLHETGVIGIAQHGCAFSFVTPEGGFSRSGTVNGNRIHMENPFVVLLADEVNIRENIAIVDGTVMGNDLHLQGTGAATGSVAGAEFSCSGETTAVFTRVDHPEALVTIVVTSFIPGNHIHPPVGESCHTDGVGVFHTGDNRIDANGNAVFSPSATSFRTRQVVTVSPDGSVVAVPQTLPTEEYAWDALVDGRIDPRDFDSPNLNDCSLLHRVGIADTREMRVDTQVDGALVRVRIHGGAANPLILGAPAIDWDFTFILDFSGAWPTYTFEGKHDGFPAYEVYMNGQEVWTYDPGPPSCEMRVTALSGEVLIDSLPVYCFDQVNKLIPFLDITARPDSGLIPPAGQ